MELKEKLPALSDERLRALAFNAWRIAAGGDEVRRKKARRPAPLARAEIDRRETCKDRRVAKLG
jgi:hypothetical protein